MQHLIIAQKGCYTFTREFINAEQTEEKHVKWNIYVV